jgi:opacity protein-like surface antigen
MVPRGLVRPFGGVGAGLVRVRAADRTGHTLFSQTDWGLSAGGGALVMLNEFVGVRGEVRYFRHFTRHDDLPLVEGGPFGFWRTSAGVTYVWSIR